MSHDDYDLRHAVGRLNDLSAQLLEVGRSTPVGSLVGPAARLTSGLKPTAGFGWGIVVGSAAVLAVSAILKGRTGAPSGEPAEDPAAPTPPVPPAAQRAAGAAEAAGAAMTAEADAAGTANTAPARTRTKAAPRRKTRKSTGDTR